VGGSGQQLAVGESPSKASVSYRNVQLLSSLASARSSSLQILPTLSHTPQCALRLATDWPRQPQLPADDAIYTYVNANLRLGTNPLTFLG